ncbi:helix-turn-helix transcriptional regulator [Desemzia sp. RIT804]|uniref:AraC family transcriptional regulator n=1 Tax=Desemzia sp. RIT 804 TaxID=2810209 RepID=UPI00195151F4|nr:AraC family transcriptional regulator [Desemzia sp. RIT 804]MBM6614668.1 helix-turn-helix transcriptional regulator [Desemzia sp. RIT 804]
MLKIDAKIFNPEILYIFDAQSKGSFCSKNHHHDFVEMSVIVSGEIFYNIEGKATHLNEQTVVLFNPGISHYEYSDAEMSNVQLHIGIRNFNIDRFPKDYFPITNPIIKLSEHNSAFFETCQEILLEREQSKQGSELLLKSLVLKLFVLLLRDAPMVPLTESSLLLTKEEQEKISLVDEVVHYLENNYMEDITVNQIAHHFYTSPASLSRMFKDRTGETLINYLIQLRLSKAKEIIEEDMEISIRQISKLVGYEDAYYFSKLFKKYYGKPPTLFQKEMKFK